MLCHILLLQCFSHLNETCYTWCLIQTFCEAKTRCSWLLPLFKIYFTCKEKVNLKLLSQLSSHLIKFCYTHMISIKCPYARYNFYQARSSGCIYDSALIVGILENTSVYKSAKIKFLFVWVMHLLILFSGVSQCQSIKFFLIYYSLIVLFCQPCIWELLWTYTLTNTARFTVRK